MFDVVRDTKYTPFSSMDIHLLDFFILFYFYFFHLLLHLFRLYSAIFNETQQMMCFCFSSSSCYFSISRSDSLYVSQIVPFSAINKNQQKNPWVWCLMKYYYERLNVVCECVSVSLLCKRLFECSQFLYFSWNNNSSQSTKRSKGKYVFA